MNDSIIKSVLLDRMGLESSSRDVNSVITVYEKRYGSKVSNWLKLEQDLRVLLESSNSKKRVLGRIIVHKAIEKGLNYVYISNDSDCKEFRKTIYTTKRNDFMNRVRCVFN